MDEYNIQAFESKGFVYDEICKGIYRLKEAGIIALNRLVENVAPRVSPV